MKKTLTAVAVLGALSGAAMATEVTLYGIVDTGFTYQHTEGGDDSFAMTSGNYAGPRFGFKGTEDLGDNLTLGFVLEAGFNSDTGAQGEDGKILNRESQIYLSGDWGTLGFGRVGGFSSGMSSLSWYWDFEPFETGYVDAGIQASQVNVWNVHSNTIYYVSPTFAGAKLGVQYSLTNEADDEDDRWVNNSKWLNVALRWDGSNVKVIGAVEAEFYGDSSEYYGTDYDTKNWEDAFSYKLAATWTPGGRCHDALCGLELLHQQPPHERRQLERRRLRFGSPEDELGRVRCDFRILGCPLHRGFGQLACSGAVPGRRVRGSTVRSGRRLQALRRGSGLPLLFQQPHDGLRCRLLG